MAIFTFEPIDPNAYRRKARMITFALLGQLVIFGLLFAMLLASAFGPGLWPNVFGVVLGLLATSALFAVLRERPWMREVRYVGQLKQSLSHISSYLPALRRGVEEDNRSALDVLAFFYAGLDQMAELNGRTRDANSERDAERRRIDAKREELGLPARVEHFDPQDLSAFTR
ncbi:DUF3087 domain-containing protein [Halomonas dongshanensis]|uniref:DUF3087 domain-containing protein n=1 Tax=Halomonas dongshanensis TaxID=2890835 RepID=A0ABT2EGP5_9GAMM|nr:DUF3087 domain-containing protein [Halomonas dongshanensis]MCS2610756.1 DUF3087 domain-containing protein [Halomonas dongshanensis]